MPANFTIELFLQLSTLDYTKLYLPAQFNDDGLQNPSNGLGIQNSYNGDVSAGFISYTDKWWFGYSAHHINRPSIAFTDLKSRWPIKHALITGYRIPLKRFNKHTHSGSVTDYYLYPTAHYKFQAKADQFDLGLYAKIDHLMIGVTYRGIPFKKYHKSIQNNESVIPMLGWQYHGWRVTYSYDAVFSTLTDAQPRGAHEINITYINLKKYKKVSPMKFIPCPDFME